MRRLAFRGAGCTL
ncbi:hypothetical protein E2320_015145, partial [Naja naja]